jgi:cation diffusion facilitator family transporter
MSNYNNSTRSQQSQAVTVVGGIVNIVLAFIKITVGGLSGAQSLVADGVHSLSDLITDVMVWFAAKHSAEAPDKDHPYGHGRFETIAALGLGIFLGFVAVGIVYNSVVNLGVPFKSVEFGGIAALVATASIASKEALYHYTMRIAKRLNSPLLKANAWHHRTDSISSILVLIGIIGSLLGFVYLDAIAAILVGVMIAKIAWELSHDALTELVDTALEPEQVDKLKHTLINVDGVKSLHMLRTRRVGGNIIADVHIEVESYISVSEGHMIAVKAETAAHRVLPELNDITVHIDPEDDKSLHKYILPGRDVVEADISAILQKHGLSHKRLNLHYIDNSIEIEIETDTRLEASLKKVLNQIITANKSYGSVRWLQSI